MYEVLFGVDSDVERAQAQVRTVLEMPVRTEDIHVTILHDFTDNVVGASVSQVESVRRASERLEDAGIEVTLEESSGEPAKAIIEMADDIDADLIVVAGRKRSPTGKLLFGSVTQEVILSTEHPVLVCSASDL